METQLVTTNNVAITSQIVQLPGRPAAMLDRDIAPLFGVTIKRLNQQVNRNSERFPEPEYCFNATEKERLQIATMEQYQVVKWNKYPPRLFTRQGCNMIGTVLNTPEAVSRTKVIIEAFTALESGQLPALSSADVRMIVRESLAEAVPAILKQIEAANKKVEDHLDEINGLTTRERARLWSPIKQAIDTIADKKTRRSYEARCRNMIVTRAGGRYANITAQQKDDLFLFAEQIAVLLFAPTIPSQATFNFFGD